jgi:steroid 5-alpha reductase family enzyme
MKTNQAVFGILISVILGTVLSVAASAGSGSERAISVFLLCGIVAYGIQWVGFVAAWLKHTEHFFDLIGSITYVTVISIALLFSKNVGTRSVILAILVITWALRLGSFLVLRVKRQGSDSRFNVMKHKFAWFLFTWTVQGLWVLVTASAALAAITSADDKNFGLIGFLGLLVWVLGFSVEVISDEAKRKFRSQEENKDRFISSGLWAISRHPNYLGEILLWTGVAIIAIPALSGWSFVTLVSPLFVWLLLTKISGIPMLEKKS